MTLVVFEDRIFSLPGSLDRILFKNNTVHIIHGEWAEPLSTKIVPFDDERVSCITRIGILDIFPKEFQVQSKWNKQDLEELILIRFVIEAHSKGFLVKRKSLSTV